MKSLNRLDEKPTIPQRPDRQAMGGQKRDSVDLKQEKEQEKRARKGDGVHL